MGDFDFLVGTWTVANRRLKQRLAGSTDWEEFESTSQCHNLLGGTANLDEFSFPDGTSGMTMRLLDRRTGQWSLNWAASGEGALLPPVHGGFTGAGDDYRGEFYGDDRHEGTPVRVRYVWSHITPTSARWEQAFSTDGEQTWEVNWIMDFTRR